MMNASIDGGSLHGILEKMHDGLEEIFRIWWGTAYHEWHAKVKVDTNDHSGLGPYINGEILVCLEVNPLTPNA
jgi:hypothetical protein